MKADNLLNHSIALGVCALALAITPFTARGQNSIGINYAGRQWSWGGNTPMNLNFTDSAGVVPQINWNNVGLDGGSPQGLPQVTGPNAGTISDNSGAATSVTMTYTLDGEWAVDQTIHTGNQQLLDGFIDNNGSAPVTITLGNIPFSVYKVYVYVSENVNGDSGNVSINGGSPIYFLTDTVGYSYANPLIQATATSAANAVGAQYVLFTNVTGASLQVVETAISGKSGVAGIQIVDASPTIYKPTLSQPASEELYAGRTAQFTVTATGTSPFAYQWQSNNVNLVNGGNIFGSTTNVLDITNVSASDDANYDVVVTNIGGSTTSSSAQLTVVTPVNAYEPAILSNNPVAYYRFNEAGDSVNTPDLQAFDYINGDNGIYGDTVLNGFYGIAGPAPADGFPGFELGNAAIQFTPGYNSSEITVPSWPINTNTVTLTAWVYPLGTEAASDGLIFNRGANVAGLTYSGSTDTNGNYTLGYTWNNDGNTYGWNSGLVPPVNQWSFVALVVTPTNATIYVANTNGAAFAVHNYPHVVQSFSGPIGIGDDLGDASGSRVFNGNMDEVAVFNQALAPGQIAALFSSASGIGLAPQITMLTPSLITGFPSLTTTFTASVFGTGPFSYSWYQGTKLLTNGGTISGANTPSLTITSATANDAGSYTLLVTNSAGSSTSTVSTLDLGVPPSAPYAKVVLAANPYAYWRLNETSGTTAHDSMGGYDGTYASAVQLGGPGQESAGLFGMGADTASAVFSGGTANCYVAVPALNLNTNTVTIMAWVYPTAVPDPWTGIFMCSTPNADGMMFRDTPSQLGMYWDGGFWYDGTGLTVPVNQWSLVALSVEPTDATLYVMNSAGTNSWFNNAAMTVEPWSNPARIGSDPYSISRTFNGYINEVAVFNRTLTGAQLGRFYTTAITAQAAAPILQMQKSGTNPQLTWSQGMLLQSTNVVGPWTTNSSATSPFIVNPTGPQMFYRLQSQ